MRQWLAGVFLVFFVLAGCGQELKKENEQLKGQVAALEKENVQLKDQLATLKTENEALQKQVEDVRQEMESLSEKLKQAGTKPKAGARGR